MTATKTSCGRCSRTLEDTPVGVSVDGGPMHPTDPEFCICPVCAGSLARWLERGRRRAATSRPVSPEPEEGKQQPHHREHRSRRLGRARRNRKALLRNIGLLALLILVNAFFVMMVIKFVSSPSESG